MYIVVFEYFGKAEVLNYFQDSDAADDKWEELTNKFKHNEGIVVYKAFVEKFWS